MPKKKFEIEKYSKLDIEPLLPTIQNLSAQGYDISDIGMILGFAGKDAAVKRLDPSCDCPLLPRNRLG